MKFLGNKKLTLPLFIGGLLFTACFDPANNPPPQEDKQEVKTDTIKSVALIVPVEWAKE